MTMPDVEERSDKHAELDYRNLMVSQENKVRQITDELGQKPSDDLRVNLVRLLVNVWQAIEHEQQQQKNAVLAMSAPFTHQPT